MTLDPDAPSWWGGHGRSDDRLTLLDLVRNNTLDLKLAALLWLLVDKKASIVVAAAPQLAGKTTLLTALIDFMPPRYTKVFTRGRNEDFSFLSSPDSDASNTYILVPELSDHTPAYLWGEEVRTLFQALDDGYSMGATMHADTPEEVVGALQAPPVNVPRGLLRHLHLIVTLRLVYGERGLVRRVSLLTSLASPDSDGRGLTAQRLARWEPDGDAFILEDSPETRAALAGRAGMAWADVEADLARRAKTLRSWLKRGPIGPGELRQLVARH